MVSLNLTLLIELGLFLVFLWGTGRFVLRPILRIIDERQAVIGGDLDAAADDEKAAALLESEYREETVRIRQEAETAFREARYKAQSEHSEFLTAERQRAEEIVAAVRAEARQLADAERPKLREAVPEIAALLARKLTRGNGDAEGANARH